MNITIGPCPYCSGRGYEYVEEGSSLTYRCPDCRGSGERKRCGDCGEVFTGDYCEECYGECSSCEDIVPQDELSEGLCLACQKRLEAENA